MLADALTFTKAGTAKKLTPAEQNKPGGAVASARRAGGFVWVNMVDPTDDEMRSVAAELALHPLAAADIVDGRQQPKVQRYDQHLFVVMWTLLFSNPNADISIGETFIFIGEAFLLTIQKTEDKRRKPLVFRSLLEDETRPTVSLMSLAYAIMAVIVAGYTKVADAIENELEALEKQVFDEQTEDDAKRIYALRQKIGKVDRASSSLATSLKTSQEHFEKLTVDHEDVQPYLRDLLDDLVGTASLTTDQSAALDGVVSTHENNVASQQNRDMRKISALAALLAIPTVTAGLYGMNFKNLPGVDWPFGWLVTVMVIVALDVWAFIGFKRRHWL